MSDVIVAYKGFDKNMRCRGVQFEVGATYKHDGPIEICKSGFHGCENPLDVFRYYPPGSSVYAQTEQSGEIARHSEDSKIASSVLHVSAMIGFAEIVHAAIQWTRAKAPAVVGSSATGGNYAHSATSGYGANSATSGDGANSATSGDGAHSATSGNCANSATSGYGANSATSGKNSVSAAIGRNSRAKASETGAICLVEYADDGTILNIRASKVSENGIKPDTWYQLVNGKFKECT